VFESRVLRKTFGLKMEEVTKCWRKLHNEDEMGGACSLHVRDEKCTQNFNKEIDHFKNLGIDGRYR
jgi:hypothetical protein